MKNLLIMKFGGTSMGSAERIRVAAEIIVEHKKVRPVAVVVSAMSKITDLLLDTMRRAELGDSAMVQANLKRLLDSHLETSKQLLNLPEPGKPLVAASDAIRALINEFERIA